MNEWYSIFYDVDTHHMNHTFKQVRRIIVIDWILRLDYQRVDNYTFITKKGSNFWQPTITQGPIILTKSIREYLIPIHYACFVTFGAEIGQLRLPKSVSKVHCEIEFWAILLQNGLKSQFLMKLKRRLWSEELTNLSFEGVKRRVLNGSTTFFNSFFTKIDL